VNERTEKRVSTADSSVLRPGRALVAIVAGLAALASCRTLRPSLEEETADSSAYGALPPVADFHAVARPSLAPELVGEYLAGMPQRDAALARDFLKRTRTAYAAFNAPSGGWKGPYYVLLSGRYPRSAISSALDSSADAVKKGSWWSLSGGMSVAVPSDRFILLTNADMATFLKRYASRAARAEDGSGEVHPLDGMLARERAAGGNAALRVRCGAPSALARSPALGAFLEIPLEGLEAEIDEEGGDALMSVSFVFQSDDAARIFLPATRTLGLALLKVAGAGAGSAKAVREGRTNVLEGIRLPTRTAAAFLGRFAGRAP